MSFSRSHSSLIEAQKGKYAIGAFNIVDENTSAAVVAAANELNVPVILQTSVKTVEWFGPEEIACWVRTIAEKSAVPVSLNLDHCQSFEMIKNCVAAGWTDVMFDGSHLPFEDNIRQTAEVVEYAHSHDVCVEGELGAIAGVEDDISVAVSVLTEPDDAVRFVSETGIDVFAPAIGTAHGMYHKEPVIEFDRLAEISARVTVPIAIHGGTGLSAETIRKLIRLGGVKINVSTAIKQTYQAAVNGDADKMKSGEPLAVIKRVFEDVSETAKSLMVLFTKTDRSSEESYE
ncbi:ketose-bisphosphate aldolase [Candidatus Latescibacterota bacterium]